LVSAEEELELKIEAMLEKLLDDVGVVMHCV